MPYLSKVLNAKIEDSADKTVGKLIDILIEPVGKNKYNPLEFLIVSKGKEKFCIPFSEVEIFSSKEVSLKKLIEKTVKQDLPENKYVWLKRDVLDQQIVDVEGARVVRVNDLRLGNFKNKVCVLGIGVGFKSLLRRMGVEKLDILSIFKVNLIDWRKAELVKSGLKIDTVSKEMKTLHPADLANIIEDLTVKQGEELVNSMDEREAAEVIEELEPELQKILVNHLGSEKTASVLRKMSIDEIVDLMRMLPKEETKEYLSLLEKRRAKEVEELIEYEDDTAGGLMTTEYVSVEPNNLISEVIEKIKKISPQMRSILYVYVLDNKKLLGAVSMRNLLIAEKTKKISEIYKSISSMSALDPENDLDDIMDLMTKYNLYSAAVVDKEGKMLGVVTIDDVMRELKPNA